MKRLLFILSLILLTCFSCKKQTKTIVVHCTWTDNHFIYSDKEWYAVIAEGTSTNITSLSYTQINKLTAGTNSTITFDVEDSKAASHTIVIFNDSNADKKFSSDDTNYSYLTVALNTEKEITVDMTVKY